MSWGKKKSVLKNKILVTRNTHEKLWKVMAKVIVFADKQTEQILFTAEL